MILAGVDDAGRGSVLGPLVIAGVSIEQNRIQKLVDIGVKDSKLLSPMRRRKLSKQIRGIADQVICSRIHPTDIDRCVLNGVRLYRLNYLEAKHMAVVLKQLKFDLAYVDCCDTNQDRFGKLIETLIREEKGRSQQFPMRPEKNNLIKSEHHADRNHPIVSAASIIAKVTRDSHIERLHRTNGLFGSGYPSDPQTLKFLKNFISKFQRLPVFARTSWKTIDRLNREFERVATIDDFAKS